MKVQPFSEVLQIILERACNTLRVFVYWAVKKWVDKPTFLFFRSFWIKNGKTRVMTPQKEKIKEMILPIFERLNYHLVEINLRGNINNRVLSILADTESGITMQQITELSREIADVLDMNDPIKGHYRLDVSSPGTDYPLKELWQYRKNIGRRLQVFYQTEEGIKEFTGNLKTVDENTITLENGTENLVLSLQKIEKTKIKLKW